MSATESATKDGLDINTASVEEINHEARAAADREHNLTFLQAIATYPTAVAWSLFFSLGVIMAVSSLTIRRRVTDRLRRLIHNC